MNGRQFYSNVTRILDNAYDTITRKHAEMQELVEKIRNQDGKYSADHIRNVLEPQRMALAKEIENEKIKAQKSAYDVIDTYIAQFKAENELNGSDMNADAGLLNCGVKLKASDLEAMLRRNDTNRTMAQLIFRYAEANDIKLNAQYIGGVERIRKAEQVRSVVDVALKWCDSAYASTFERLTGIGSEFYAVFGDDYAISADEPAVAFKG